MLNRIDNLPYINQKNAFYLLLAMHIAGVIGLSIPATEQLFKSLTPFNLLATAAIVLHFEQKKGTRYGLFILLTFLIGFFAEVVGVRTGILFGEYSYGATLGFKWLDVPLAIGLNWVVLIYGTALLSQKITNSRGIQVLIGAMLMVATDFLIEPVAIQYDFWSWNATDIPLQNYLGWFLLALLLHGLASILINNSNNSLAIKLLYIQVGFFLILNII